MSLRPAPWPIFGTGGSRRATAAAEAKRSPERPHLELVQGGETPRLERLTPQARVVALVGLVGLMLFGLVAFHVVLTQGQFKLEKLQANADTQQEQYERLRLQVATLESPTRIVDEAKNRLGMIPATQVTPVTPDLDDVATTPHPASQPGDFSTSVTDGPDGWSQIKPHLSSSSK